MTHLKLTTVAAALALISGLSAQAYATAITPSPTIVSGDKTFDNFTCSVTGGKAYPSASGATKCGSERGEFVLEQITNTIASGGTDDRFSPLLDRVPAAFPG